MTWKSDTLQIGKPQVLGNEFSLAVPDKLKIVNKIYNSIEWQKQGSVICVVTSEGRVTKDGIDITDNDEAMAKCFVELLKTHHGIEVKRGN